MHRRKNILVDMSASLIHHGHIRILKKASKYGKVIVALTSDKELSKSKNIVPEIKFQFRAEILKSIKYVEKVIPSKFIINDYFLTANKIDIVISGSDYSKRKFKVKSISFNRTKNISSSLIRKLAAKNHEKNKK